MKVIAKFVLLFGLGLIVSACATQELPSRNTTIEQMPNAEASASQGAQGAQGATTASVATSPTSLSIVPGQSLVSVNSVTVRVPRSLKVSEANLYLPRGDIVWRGDPAGDRYVQVQKIFQDAMSKGVASLDGSTKVDLDIQVRRFHALTEKARYTTGGTHAITFDMALRDPKTGDLLMPVRTIRADLDGFGGRQALKAEAAGQTQKVRISDHLAKVILQELSDPAGYENASLGFYQMLNNI